MLKIKGELKSAVFPCITGDRNIVNTVDVTADAGREGKFYFFDILRNQRGIDSKNKDRGEFPTGFDTQVTIR